MRIHTRDLGEGTCGEKLPNPRGAVPAPHPPHAPGGRPPPPPPPPPAGPAGPEIAVEQHRLMEIADLRHAKAARSRERPRSAGGVPAGAERGRARDARHDLSLRLDGEQSPENRDAAHETDGAVDGIDDQPGACRSEEHTSELQSQSNLVCRLLLEKKKVTHILDRNP